MEDPFRLTMDAYWKYQAEKERKLYAIADAFSQSNGHLSVSDARYINTSNCFEWRVAARIHGAPWFCARRA